MTLPDIKYFRKECSYCFRTHEDDYIYACSCSLPFCFIHKDIHLIKPNHNIVFSIFKDVLTFECEHKRNILSGDIPEKTATDENIVAEKDESNICENSEDLSQTREKLLKLINIKGNKMCCPHKVEQDIKYCSTNCLSKKEKCNITDLLVCLSCGYSACGVKQAYIEGNNHMKDHYKESGHFKAIRNDQVYCYSCDKYVFEPEYDKILDLKNYSKIKNKNEDVYKKCAELARMNEEQKENLFNLKTIDYDFDYIDYKRSDINRMGIINIGNICYISCVFQLLADVLSFTTFHYVKCDKIPFTCTVCQIIRTCDSILSKERSIKEIVSHSQKEYINIKDLIYCLEKEGMVIEGMQQDFSELLFMVLDKLKYDKTAECDLDEVSVGLLVREWCECGQEKRIESEQYFLILQERQSDVESSTDVFRSKFYIFDEEVLSRCDCGRFRRRNTYINRLPTKLIIINKYAIENGHFITNNEILKSFDITPLLYRSKVNEDLLTEIRNLGFNEKDVCKALSLTDNDVSKSVELMLNNKVSGGLYHFKGGVKYYATGSESGHYVYLKNNILVDDKDVKAVKINEKYFKNFLVLVYTDKGMEQADDALF